MRLGTRRDEVEDMVKIGRHGDPLLSVLWQLKAQGWTEGGGREKLCFSVKGWPDSGSAEGIAI